VLAVQPSNVNKMPTDLTTSIAKEAARKANAIQQRNRMKQSVDTGSDSEESRRETVSHSSQC